MSGGDEERETKLRVDDTFALPDLTAVDGALVEDRGERRTRAVYWDTGDLVLGRSGAGLRHRDGVWAFKGRARSDGDAVVREEVEEDGAITEMPARIRERVERLTPADGLTVIVELDTVRRTLDVRRGEEAAEVVHDRVRVLDGEREAAAFCEVEVESDAASSGLAARLVALLREHGAVVDPTPKLVRGLRAKGIDVPAADA